MQEENEEIQGNDMTEEPYIEGSIRSIDDNDEEHTGCGVVHDGGAWCMVHDGDGDGGAKLWRPSNFSLSPWK